MDGEKPVNSRDGQGRLSRRTFLRGAGGVSVAISSLPLLALAEGDAATAPAPESLARVDRVFGAATVVDFHTHLGIWQGIGLEDVDPAIAGMGREKLASNVREYVDAGVNCIYLDTISDLARTRIGRPGNKDRDFAAGEAWAEYLRQYALMQELLERFPMTVVTSVDGVPEVAGRGELAVILSTEGAHMVESDPTRLETLAGQGFRRFQPIHYVASELGDSQTDPPRFGGLSPLGRDVLARAAQLGMLIDVAHASLPAVEQTVELIDRPLALSHTMIRYESARFGDYRQSRQRWITPEHARLVADTGGVIGTFPLRAPFGVDTLDAFIEAVLVMVDTVGIDHVAWSTDLGEPVRPGFLSDYRLFRHVCARLLESGFTDADLARFVGGNALRVQAAATV